MKPVVFQVRASAAAFEPLIAAARASGHRVGWLDLETPLSPPSPLAGAVEAGALRAVAASAAGVVAAKSARGQLVLRDLLREHFRGCRIVLVVGADGPDRLLEPQKGAWSVTSTDGATRSFDTAQLIARLAKPRPFG